MCAGKSCNQPTDASSVMGKPVRSMYRVLRVAVERSIPRSVDRDHAGRNAKPEGSSVKGLSPEKQVSMWWPSHYYYAKAAPMNLEFVGTTGVRDHGMYEGLITEPRRSLRSRTRLFRMEGRRLMTESNRTLPREVRCSHTSEEVK